MNSQNVFHVVLVEMAVPLLMPVESRSSVTDVSTRSRSSGRPSAEMVTSAKTHAKRKVRV
jgi:hypothetical protein